MPRAITSTDAFLAEISGKLTEQNQLLGELVDIVRPPTADTEAHSPVVVDGAERPAKRAAAKKTASRRTRREVRGT